VWGGEHRAEGTVAIDGGRPLSQRSDAARWSPAVVELPSDIPGPSLRSAPVIGPAAVTLFVLPTAVTVSTITAGSQFLGYTLTHT